MNKILHHINIILLCLNIIGLTNYCYFQTDRSISLPFIAPFAIAFIPLSNHPYLIRSLYCLVSILSLVSVFLPYTIPSVLIASCALGLSLRLGYYITNQLRYFASDKLVRIYQGALNVSISAGIILSTLLTLFSVQVTSVKLMVMVTTLTNLYLPTLTSKLNYKFQTSIKNKSAFSLVPFFMQEWVYALGYAVGVHLVTFQLFKPPKYGKYLIVAGFVLLQMLTYRQEIKFTSQMLRAVLIYHFQKQTRRTEMFFVLGFLFLRLYFTENSINAYLALGYALLAFQLWKHKNIEPQSQPSVLFQKQPSEIQMSLLNSRQKLISTTSNKQSYGHADNQ